MQVQEGDEDDARGEGEFRRRVRESKSDSSGIIEEGTSCSGVIEPQ